MTTYALIAKYQGARAIYTREAHDGELQQSVRIKEGLTGEVARKMAHSKGFVVVKSWGEAQTLAELELQAAVMQPDEPLVWKNYIDGGHRAKTSDGVYTINRYHLTETGELAPGRAGGRTGAHRWVMSFTDGDVISDIPWPAEQKQTLDNAKALCQAHANLRTLSHASA
jgi:hypothetical protein